MQDTTKLKSKKKAPIICAAVIIGILAIYLAAVIYPLLGVSYGEAMATGFLIIYGLAIIAVIAGILIALNQRLREIEGGEEEDAKKY